MARAKRVRRLADNYIPAGATVICGRGKLCHNSPGNVYLRTLIEQYLLAYSTAATRAVKSPIVSGILADVKETASPEPAFVKCDIENNHDVYYEIDDAFAREKIGSMFRDALPAQYKSSNQVKNARKSGSKRRRPILSRPTSSLHWEDTNNCFNYAEPLTNDVIISRHQIPIPISQKIQPGFFKNMEMVPRVRYVSIEQGELENNDDDISTIEDLDFLDELACFAEIK